MKTIRTKVEKKLKIDKMQRIEKCNPKNLK